MTSAKKTRSDKTSARIVGALLIIAIVASIVGGSLIESVKTTSDVLVDVSTEKPQVIIGVLLELVNGIAVIGIAVFMFPILRKHDEALGMGYVAFRTVEAVIVVAAVAGALGLLALSEAFVETGATDPAAYLTLGGSFKAVRGYLVSQMLGIFFSLGALILYYLLFQTKLVPRWLSIWGFLGAVLIFVWNLLELAGIHVGIGIALGLPIILNELVLGIWLIVKGFNSAEMDAGSD